MVRRVFWKGREDMLQEIVSCRDATIGATKYDYVLLSCTLGHLTIAVACILLFLKGVDYWIKVHRKGDFGNGPGGTVGQGRYIGYWNTYLHFTT